jgi:hypothetical protein
MFEVTKFSQKKKTIGFQYFFYLVASVWNVWAFFMEQIANSLTESKLQ